ncbi:MAG: hypothetical protein ISS80_00175 [Candidatus Cloacimonetes bacterium]|nr:hypothetical protein [Candidatus Cloacimonadota bacterium]
MGTQQILFIVLSVIIIIIAVAGGLSLFKMNAIQANRRACVVDMNNFAAHTLAWWRTPADLGGGERMQYLTGGGGGGTNYIDMLGTYLGYNYNTQSNELQTENGSFQILDGGSYSVKFDATGAEYYNGNPINIVLTINLMSNNITIVTLN